MENNIVKVLFVDDKQDNLTILKSLINESFHDAVVLITLTGKRGLDVAAIEEPDVILFDSLMTQIDRYEVCHKLKADSKLKDIPIVFIAAIKSDKENRIQAMEYGVEGFLSKPVDVSELIDQIRAMVKKRSAKHEKRNEKTKVEKNISANVTKLAKEIRDRKKSEKMLREAQKLAHIGSFELDSGTETLKCSEEALNICGITSKEFTGSPDAIF